MTKLNYKCFSLLIFSSCSIQENKTFQIHFYEFEKEVAKISRRDILQMDLKNIKFLIRNSKKRELDGLELNGVSPSRVIFTTDKDTSIAVGICSSFSSNCLSKNRSTFWYNHETKTLFEGDTLMLCPPVQGQFENELLDFINRLKN